MENNRFEKIIFVLIKLFGVLTILGACLSRADAFGNEPLLIFNNTPIIHNVYMISPKVFVGMIVSIILYLVFISFLKKHISISKKSI